MKLIAFNWRSIGVLVFLLMLGCASAFAQSAWQRQDIPDTHFSFELPGTPTYTRVPKTAAGSPYEAHTYAVIGKGTYMAITAVLPDAVDVSDPRSALERAAGASEQNNTVYESKSWQKYRGLDALELVGIRNGRTAIRSKSLLDGKLYISLIYGGPPGSAETPDVDRFINSLRIEQR